MAKRSLLSRCPSYLLLTYFAPISKHYKPQLATHVTTVDTEGSTNCQVLHKHVAWQLESTMSRYAIICYWTRMRHWAATVADYGCHLKLHNVL